MDPALSTARAVARDLAGEGADAVVLVGSRARGDAGPESDLDVLAVGPQEFSYRLERREGTLVSVSFRPLEGHREAFKDPASLCAVVPGWRGAVVLFDPEGLATALIHEARRWRWGPLEARCDRWVAEEVTSLAEEVHKLAAALRRGNHRSAAVQRSILAVRLAPVLAVHLRILYGTENRLWDLVSDKMGEGWRRAQGAALGLGGEPFDETCGAAQRLYGLAADEVWPLFDARQKSVVRHARGLAVTGGRSA